jgi:hypothetical protein
MEEYTYSVSSDFPNQQVNINILSDEIAASDISIALSHIIVNDDTCGIFFIDSLPQADENILGSLVSAHTGVTTPYNSCQISIGDAPVQGDKIWFDVSSGLIYCYDSVRESWLGSSKYYFCYSKKGKSSGMYLPAIVDSSSVSAYTLLDSYEEVSKVSLDGYVAASTATITGIFCRSRSGEDDMTFYIMKNSIVAYTFSYDGSGSLMYLNTELNIEVEPYDEIQVYVARQGRGVKNTFCRIEISWRYE